MEKNYLNKGKGIVSPKISIVILTRNSLDFIKSCLSSIFSQDYDEFEVIIVDNGSVDGTPDFLKDNYSDLILIQNKENLGACMGRNQAIEIARGQWVLTIDCDVVLCEGFLKKIIHIAECSEENIGIFQPKILMQDKKKIYSCGVLLTKLFKRFYDIGKGSLDGKRFSRADYIFGACSAAALYRRKMLEEVKEKTGYFDERLFFLVEDVDLSWRANIKGWRTFFYPEAVCQHEGNSSKVSNKVRQYLCFRNRHFMLMKNEKGISIIRIICLLFYDVPRIFFLFFTNRFFIKSCKEIRDFNKTDV